ncbi:MAG TPA: anti-sigma factor [Myxococcota bacterium]|nr:anti-sigma factor [Myxococcota bacterium]
MTDHSELHDLATLLPLGGLSPEDERRIDEHLRAGCTECERALRDGVVVADALADGVPRIDPSPELRGRILAQIAREPQAPGAAMHAQRTVAAPPPPRRRRAAFVRRAAVGLALAASVVAAVGLGLEARDLRGMLAAARARTSALEEQLASAVAERGALARELASTERMVAELTAPATRTVALAGTPELPQASARAFLDPEQRRLVLVVYDLPPPPAGRDYQLWVIVGNEPVSAGIVDVAGGTGKRHEAASLPAIDGPVTIAITIEPQGGLPKPSGPIVAAGSGGI